MGSDSSRVAISFMNKVAQIIFDKKGLNILGLDVRGLSTFADYVIIAEGSADRHVIAIGEAIIQTLGEEGKRPLYVEGLNAGDWVVLDFMGVVVHLFRPGMRDKYQLEGLWKDAEIVDLVLR